MPEGTEPNNSGDKNANLNEPKTPPTYTPEQQEHFNQTVQQRLARQEAKMKTDFDAKLAEELEKLKTELTPVPNKKKGEEDEAEKQQAKQLLEQEKANTKQVKDALAQRDRDLATAREQNAAILKQQAIRKALDSVRFHSPDEVMLLTERNIELDQDSKKYVVRENGVVKMNNSMEPMSLEEYFKGYAGARPYLVSGDVMGGAGSGENGRSGNVQGTVRAKADLKTAKEKSDYISKFGLLAFEKLPLK